MWVAVGVAFVNFGISTIYTFWFLTKLYNEDRGTRHHNYQWRWNKFFDSKEILHLRIYRACLYSLIICFISQTIHRVDSLSQHNFVCVVWWNNIYQQILFCYCIFTVSHVYKVFEPVLSAWEFLKKYSALLYQML